MALNIKSAETDRLARKLAALTGESITEAVTRALEMRLDQEQRERDVLRRERLKILLDDIRTRVAKLPVLDPRSDDEILGYNEFGTFD
jgi:antitoxin VapB